MITLPQERQKGHKNSTNPDFYIKHPRQTDGYYIEITRGENLGSRKAGQKQVMTEAGLGNNYFQLTGSEVEQILQISDIHNLLNVLRRKI